MIGCESFDLVGYSHVNAWYWFTLLCFVILVTDFPLSLAAGDPQRPFLVSERDRLLHLCQEFKVPVEMQAYFEGQKPTFKMHFEVIREMKM